MENNNGGKKLIIVFIVIIVVAVFLAIWFSVRNSGAPVNQTPTPLSFSEAQQANQTAALDVPDQFPGAVVYVSRVDFPGGGWVVIIAQRNSGRAENIIGTAFFDKDTRIGNVDLTETLIDGQTYLAQGWTDDGDAQFSTTTDQIIIKTDGSPLQVQFKATKDLPERKG